MSTGRCYLLRAWESFWFDPAPLRTYASLRLALGLVGLVGVLQLLPVPTFWLPGGLIPTPGGGSGMRATLTELGLGEAFGWGLFLGLLVAFACMTVGLLTEIAVVSCFVGSVVQALWNPFPLSGTQRVLTNLLFCLMWADCGARYSLDSARGGRRPAWVTQQAWPLRLLQVQVAVVYLSSGIGKLFGETWREGSSIYLALNLNGYQRFPGALPVAAEPVTVLATYTVLFWELSFPFLLLERRLRLLALGAGVLIHAGIAATMEVGAFSLVMPASYLAFLGSLRRRASAPTRSRDS
jgi:hypothetical protein